MRHAWSVLCSRGVLDKYTNNASLFDVIEQIRIKNPTELPDAKAVTVYPIKLALVTLWTRSDLQTPEAGRARMRVVAPDGKEVGSGEDEIDLNAHRRTRVFTRLEGFPFHGVGLYEFLVEFQEGDEWRKVAAIPLEVLVGSEAEDPLASE